MYDMNFKDYREDPIPDQERWSCAEALCAMDCIMHHMNDEDELECWLQDGVPDSDNWHPFGQFCRIEGAPDESVDRLNYYDELVKGMTYGDYEACVMIFANAVTAQCFRTKYSPRAIT